MSNKSSIRISGDYFFTLLAILFIALKLLDKISWSWWWVLAPIWLPTTIAIVVFVLVVALQKR
jgi:hypothetical protein